MMSNWQGSRNNSRNAFTLIECFVVIAIIGLLLALLLPAVQASRESARNSRCLNNLRQIGLSLSNYQTGLGSYPLGNNGQKSHSVHSMLLPYLELSTVFDSINFSNSSSDVSNRTAEYTVIAIFLCPSSASNSPIGSTSYPCNVGYGKLGNGAFIQDSAPPTTPSSITDGLSNTIAASEWAFTQDFSGNLHQLLSDLGNTGQFELFVSTCLTSKSNLRIARKLGTPWIDGNLSCTLYNHDLPLNSWSCINSSDETAGAWTAGSLHPKGVNSLFMDGHVTRVRDTIALGTWRALGSRASGELVNSSEL